MTNSQEFKVRRIVEGNHSRVEPAFDPDWSLLTKLRWHAAVASLDSDTGVAIHVRAGHSAHKPRWSRRWITIDDVFSINVGHSAISPMGYHEAWTFITGIGLGLRAAADVGIREENT